MRHVWGLCTEAFRFSKLSQRLLCLLAILIPVPTGVCAQTDTGQISGTVRLWTTLTIA